MASRASLRIAVARRRWCLHPTTTAAAATRAAAPTTTSSSSSAAPPTTTISRLLWVELSTTTTVSSSRGFASLVSPSRLGRPILNDKDDNNNDERNVTRTRRYYVLSSPLESSFTTTTTSTSNVVRSWQSPSDHRVYFHSSSLVLEEKAESGGGDAAAAVATADQPEEDSAAPSLAVPELAADVQRHRDGLDDATRPAWQNPLHHNNPETEQIFSQDFANPEDFAKAQVTVPVTLDDDDDRLAAPAYLQEIAEEVVHLTMLEMNELVNRLGDHYGFSEHDLAPDDDGSGGDDDDDDNAGAVQEEKTAFDVKLLGFDDKAKIKVIKEVRALAGLGLKEAKALVEGAPAVVQKDIKKEQAEEIKAKLEELGAKVEIV